MASARHFAVHQCRPWTPLVLVLGVFITPVVEQPGLKPSSFEVKLVELYRLPSYMFMARCFL
jgi:hypothetical protein